MIWSRTPLWLLLVCSLAGGCAPGLLAPASFVIEVEGAEYEVRRHAFVSRGGFVEIAPVEVRRATQAGFAPTDRDLARAVLARYCARFRFQTGPPDTSYWTTGGSWHFVQGCIRSV